jgi:hypothetical protein
MLLDYERPDGSPPNRMRLVVVILSGVIAAVIIHQMIRQWPRASGFGIYLSLCVAVVLGTVLAPVVRLDVWQPLGAIVVGLHAAFFPTFTWLNFPYLLLPWAFASVGVVGLGALIWRGRHRWLPLVVWVVPATLLCLQLWWLFGKRELLDAQRELAALSSTVLAALWIRALPIPAADFDGAKQPG